MEDDSSSQQPDNVVRYSQMSEQDAAQQFEKRRQMLLQGLQRQHQLLTKKTDKPPRHSSAKNFKQPPAKDTPQGQFIVFKPQSDTQQDSRKHQSAKKMKKQESPKHFEHEKMDRFKSHTKNSSLAQDQLDSIQKIRSSNRKENKDIDAVDPKSMTQPLFHETKPNANIPQPHPEPSPVKQIKFDSNSKGKIKNLLGEIGSLDLEIRRLQNEQSSFVSPSNSQNLVQNGAQNPYFEVRRRDAPVAPQGTKQSTAQPILMKNSRVESVKNGSHRSSSHDLATKSSYSTKAMKRKTNDSHRKENQKSPSNRDKVETQPEFKANKQADEIKPLNITIQFQQSIDNSRNLFSPNMQFDKKMKNTELGERLIATDRKKRRTNQSPAPGGSSKKAKDMTKQQVQAFAMQLLKNPSLKSLKQFEETQLQNVSIPGHRQAPTPQPRNEAYTFSNVLTLGPEDSNSTKSHTTVQKTIVKPTQMSFQDRQGQGVEAQIDEAVKLYNNLKNLIQSKSNGSVKYQAITNNQGARKLTTLDQFDLNVGKESRTSHVSDMPLRVTNSFFKNFDSVKPSSGLIKKYEEKQQSLLVQAKCISEYFKHQP